MNESPSAVARLPYVAYQVRQELKPSSMAGFSERVLDEHWKLYDGYVTNVNLLNKMIRDVLDTGKELYNAAHAEMQRRLGFEYNGMVLHEYYFGALKAGVSLDSLSPLRARLQEDFGGFERWKKQFMEIGRFRGVGWVVLSYDPLLKRLQNFWITDHETGNVAGFTPILVMDVWEHAYVLDHGSSSAADAGRAAYLKAYFNNVDWDVVSDRLETALAQKPVR
jgi:superoxide dismutase, Fe-Mn family